MTHSTPPPPRTAVHVEQASPVKKLKFYSHGYKQSGVEQNFWHERRQCPCGYDVFQTLHSIGIMDKWNRAGIFGMRVDIANEDEIEYYAKLNMKMT